MIAVVDFPVSVLHRCSFCLLRSRKRHSEWIFCLEFFVNTVWMSDHLHAKGLLLFYGDFEFSCIQCATEIQKKGIKITQMNHKKL